MVVHLLKGKENKENAMAVVPSRAINGSEIEANYKMYEDLGSLCLGGIHLEAW